MAPKRSTALLMCRRDGFCISDITDKGGDVGVALDIHLPPPRLGFLFSGGQVRRAACQQDNPAPW